MDRLQVLHRHLSGGASASGDQTELHMAPTLATSGTSPTFPQAQTMASFPPACHDMLHWDELLTDKEKETKYKVRKFMEYEVAPIIAGFWERAEFPHQVVPKLAKLNLGGGTIKGFGCAGQSVVEAGLTCIELARVDGSMSTFLMVHNSLCMLTIDLLGSEEQKQQLLPDLAALKTIGAWGLTEPSNGSDASALQTSATKVDGGYELNGCKRWIGNATFADWVVIWARNNETNQVNAFVVKKGTKGFKTTKIENKIALRCVQNADIMMDKCFVPDSARLPGVNSFKDTNKVLAISRIMVAWQPLGLAMGTYDMCNRYLQQRQQFGSPLAAFQANQEKLSRMLGSINAMFLMCFRLSKLHEAGKMSHADASMVKAWTTLRGREVVALGRELLGGNGIVSDYLCAKTFCDMEAYYTYEGTYEVNALVVGREATKIAAFKAPPKRSQQSKPNVQA